MHKEKIFSRKIYTFKLLMNDLGFLFLNFPKIISMKRNKEISKTFIEKIMTVVTAVNGCVYCAWFHAKQSLKSGIDEKEVKNMLNLQFHTDASDFEIIGLLYAQHYAETDRKPDTEMKQKLVDFYGNKTANHIILIIRMIYFGNLSGNTFDAFLNRFKGKKAANSNVIFEFFFFIFNVPFLLPLMPFVKKYRK
ncbi:MAG: carboxymuconolactone decarboxylase family protein [Bacteroidetes bacterium]|nr:MAG: carboxymuconolactone decarboxylase family protein [Bacteroidota bacterium]